MSNEENLELREEKCNCICHSKSFRKFLVVALGSFVGVFCALSLFAALHKPPMPPCGCYCHRMMRPPIEQMDNFRGHRGDFHKPVMKHRLDRKTPFEAQTDRAMD